MANEVATAGMESPATPADDDQALIALARTDPEAVGRLYDRHYAGVFRFIYHCTLDRTLSEDLTSNVFLSAMRHLGRFRWRSIPFRAWLHRIATNELRMHWRRQQHLRRTATEPEAASPEHEPSSACDSLVIKEDHRLVQEALCELDPKYRTVIVLRYLEDKPLAEISELTGLRLGTIKAQLHRGLFRLQETLRHRGCRILERSTP